MPLRLDVKRKLLARSDRVKCVDLHPTEPWMLASLYNGHVHIWNYETQQLVKTFEICDLPVRASKFVVRKHWVVAGSDDMQVRVFNYNTLERVHQFEAHSDYLRCIAVHPTLPYVLTSSDDMTIKLWDWENKWQNKQTFEGHTHYVMQVVINPKDNNTFATASLDRTIKVWQLGSKDPNFTLEGHEKGVNCVDYYHGGEKPYIISGADDRLVKIWDYQNKTCVATLDGHAANVSAVCFHPELPIILTGSEDSTVRIWHSNTHRLETTLNYGLERVWAISALRGTNSIAIGYDEGSIIIKLGREEPAVSMDSSGKILWARHSEIQQANLKAIGPETEIKDGERLPLSVKDMGACEIYPQTVLHNPNGRFVVVCGDGEYIIYTAMALRNKAYGSAQEFVWGADASVYAVRETNSQIKVFKNFKELRVLKPDGGAEGIFGGTMLAVKAANSLSFYDWEQFKLIRRVEIVPKNVFWSESGELVSIVTDDSFYVLRYNEKALAIAANDPDKVSEDGVEDSFDVVGENQESIKTGLWIGDCFVYTTAHNRLNYYVGGELVTIAHLDRTMYLIGYIAAESRLYLCDKDLVVVSYQLLLPVLEYQTAVMRRDFETADRVLTTIPKDHRTRVAHFLEKQGFKQQALAVSQDPEHKFDLALQLGDLKVAYQLALESDAEEKWKQLSQVATAKSELILAGECLGRAKDYGGLLLLSTSAGSGHLMQKLSTEAEASGSNNIAFASNFLCGKLDECLNILIKTDRLPEAAFFAKTYVPSQVPRIVSLWKEKAATVNQKIADSLADPERFENLFARYDDSLKAEAYLRQLAARPIPATAYSKVPSNADRNIFEEVAQAETSGAFRPSEFAASNFQQQNHLAEAGKQQQHVLNGDLEVDVLSHGAYQQQQHSGGTKQPTPQPIGGKRHVSGGSTASSDAGGGGAKPSGKPLQPPEPSPSAKSPAQQKSAIAAQPPHPPNFGDDEDEEDQGEEDFWESNNNNNNAAVAPNRQAPDVAASSKAAPDLVPAAGGGPDIAAHTPGAAGGHHVRGHNVGAAGGDHSGGRMPPEVVRDAEADFDFEDFDADNLGDTDDINLDEELDLKAD